MPYITQDDREKMEQEIRVSRICEYFGDQDPKDAAGRLNYLNARIAVAQAKKHGRYWVFALFVGTMICCVLEVYRKLVSKYEDRKEKDNGGVW